MRVRVCVCSAAAACLCTTHCTLNSRIAAQYLFVMRAMRNAGKCPPVRLTILSIASSSKRVLARGQPRVKFTILLREIRSREIGSNSTTFLGRYNEREDKSVDRWMDVQMARSFFIADPINYQRDSSIVRVRSLSDRLKGERSHSPLVNSVQSVCVQCRLKIP